MKFPRPSFNPDDKPDPEFTALVSEFVREAVKQETDALEAKAREMLADPSLPGISVRSEYKMSGASDTYIIETTVAFDPEVPHMEVRYHPTTGFGIGPYQP